MPLEFFFDRDCVGYIDCCEYYGFLKEILNIKFLLFHFLFFHIAYLLFYLIFFHCHLVPLYPLSLSNHHPVVHVHESFFHCAQTFKHISSWMDAKLLVLKGGADTSKGCLIWSLWFG